MRRYHIVDGPDHRVLGSQTCTIRSPRERVCDWGFTDRGLGPKLTSRIVVDDEGLPTFIENRGSSPRATPDELLTRGREPGMRVAEQGGAEEEAVLAGRCFARPIIDCRSSPAAKRPSRASARLRSATAATRSASPSTRSPGSSLRPTPSGSRPRRGVLRRHDILAGWGRAGAAISAAGAARGRAAAELVATWRARRPTAGDRARAPFDAESARVRPDSTVIVEHGRFPPSGLTARSRRRLAPRFIDATGKTLLPRLWDLHVHPDEAALCFGAPCPTARCAARRGRRRCSTRSVRAPRRSSILRVGVPTGRYRQSPASWCGDGASGAR